MLEHMTIARPHTQEGRAPLPSNNIVRPWCSCSEYPLLLQISLNYPDPAQGKKLIQHKYLLRRIGMELTPQQVIIITLVHCLVTISKITVAKTKSAASTRWDDINCRLVLYPHVLGIEERPVPALRLSAKHNWRNQFATELGCREIHTLTLDTGMGNGRDGITPLVVAVRKGPKRCIVLELRTRAWRWCAVCRDPATFAWNTLMGIGHNGLGPFQEAEEGPLPGTPPSICRVPRLSCEG